MTVPRERGVAAPFPNREVAIISATQSGGGSCPPSRLTTATISSGSSSSTASMTAAFVGAVAAPLRAGEALVVEGETSGLVGVAGG
jgi:hypothetical protein